MIFRCRFVVPAVSDWFEINETSPERAANELHSRNTPSYNAGRNCTSLIFVPNEAKPGANIYFARIEVEGHKQFISRVLTSSIVRRGGVKYPPPSLEEIARRLGWEGAASEMLDEDAWIAQEPDWR